MRLTSFVKDRNSIGKSVTNVLTGFFSEYETQKLVLIHSVKYVGLRRIIQIIVLIYFVIYFLIYEKGYQKQSTAIVSSVALKVKGIGYVRTPENKTIIMDVADYIIPASENNAIFVMTTFIETDQRRSTCAESSQLKQAKCRSNSDCVTKSFIAGMNGLWTGRCLFTSKSTVIIGAENTTNSRTGLCEYEGWCPPEDDAVSPMYIRGPLGFRIFIKNFIEFPAFGVKHKNMVADLKPCVFHPTDDKDCPIFPLDYIVNQAENDSNERDLMLQYGGVIGVKLNWICNLDRNIKMCKPQYSFARLDVPYREKPFSVGFNFRYASTWKHERGQFRTLTKVYGLRFIIATSGKAGKFDFITLSLNIGSLVGIFGLATFVCDIIILNLSKRAKLYRKHICETVHFRTRFSSAIPLMKMDSKGSSSNRLNPRRKDETTLLNELITDSTKIREKTVGMRSLIVNDMNHLHCSPLV
ncbi:unnamed protein product [Rotaria socialis]|uniref:P2X purinoceptor n=4 Tax=Rotaria socialis TaxID=392032 RepID=A0A820Q7N3_9BILA|nr:unnamed protein product [Rotaria socialis]CAF3442332.1 unnamed protein product [Rotaria socialis]CAF3722196.1 unnamed protein product [Rotaria socialis]CAF4189410.1 unnamed protein product [Rotaria socialis]CAF4414963.1 unnamed protein product [Rotaria socialis]